MSSRLHRKAATFRTITIGFTYSIFYPLLPLLMVDVLTLCIKHIGSSFVHAVLLAYHLADIH